MSLRMKHLAFALLLLVPGCARLSQSPAPPASEADAHFTRLADEYLDGYLAWRPQSGTALGFHQYDGKITDFSQHSIQAELTRLRSYDSQLAELQLPGLVPSLPATTVSCGPPCAGSSLASRICRFIRATR
jgi:hypothetical protein